MAPKRMVRKAVVGVIGGTVVATGIVLIPLPGPGTLIVFGGLAILGTEFDAAQRGADRIKTAVRKAVGRDDPQRKTELFIPPTDDVGERPVDLRSAAPSSDQAHSEE